MLETFTMKRTAFTVKPNHEGKRLFIVIAEQLEVSKKQAQALIDAKAVLVNGKRNWIRRHLVKAGDEIELLQHAVTPEVKKIAILWQDESYLIVNKPPGILSNASAASLEARLQKQERNPHICAVHRLDKETSGCLLFATSEKAKKQRYRSFADAISLKSIAP